MTSCVGSLTLLSRGFTQKVSRYMALVRAFVVFLSLFCSSEAFLATAQLGLDSDAALKTRDHAIITKLGLLQSMAEFFKENPQYIDAAGLGEFSSILISADNPTDVEKFLSFITSKMRLQNVITEIQSSNAEVNSAPLKHVAAAHFSGEQFKEGSKRLLELKSAIVTTLLKGVKFEHARQLAGQYLHTLQDFYSHSNWVELGNRVKAYDTLTNGGNSIPPEFIADANEATCIPCSLVQAEQNNNCDNNLITQKITSGYRGEQDISKPANASKCIHGGILDSNGDKGKMGGINKDSAAREWSPHYKLHAVAAELAIEATKKFFEDLRAAVGDHKFARFLNLQAVRTLALVIDDTGSMGEEIKSVKTLSTDFVQTSDKSAANTAFVYILVPFNDPDVGPVTVTSNPNEVIEAVNSLKAHEGGDCPEQGMSGLYQALLQSVQDSVIHFFSDADAKDLNLAPVVLILAKQKRVKINFILTGKCSYKRKRRSVLGSQDLYQNLAAATGGQVLVTKKREVSVVVDILGSQSLAGDSDDLLEVVLLHVSSDSKEEVRNMSFSIEVDNTLENILIVLSAEGDPSITLFNPPENQPITVKMKREYDHIQVTEVGVGSFEGGALEIRVRCTGPYSLQVTGRSTLDFTYHLSSVHNTDTGETKPLLGSPVRGQTLLLNMAFTKPELVDEVTSLSLVSLNGSVMESFAADRSQGIYSGLFYVLFTPSTQRFRLQLTGNTTQGRLLRRVKPTEITIETVELGFESAKNSSRIFPGAARKIPLQIRNVGRSQNFSLKATDDLGFVKAMVPNYCFVAQNETAEFALELRAPRNASAGETGTVTVYATPTDSGKISNYMVFYVSVTAKEADNFPPKCEVGNQTTKCDAMHNLSNCSDVKWSSYFSVFEIGQGLLTITPRNPKLGQLTVEPFKEGLSNRSVTAIYTSTCCNPTASIIAVDMSGNTGSCELSAVTQVINIEADTENAELNLKLRETSKLEFLIRNLGTKGSFTLQALDNKHFISYVAPLNVNLDHNEEAKGEVILTGQRETGSKKTSLLIKAVPLTKKVNVSHVKLLEISVTVGSWLGWNVTADAYPKLLIIQYGVKAVLNITLKNNGLPGRFDLKASPSKDILAHFTPNSVYLNTNEKLSLKLTMVAKQNRLLEETLVISAMPQPSGKKIRLFSQNVKIILKDEIIPALKSLVPSGQRRITAGTTVRVNFTIINVGHDETFTFKVSSPVFLTCHVTPESALLKQNKEMLGHLTVKSPASAEPGNIRVTVTAISTAANTKTDIYTLEIIILPNKIIEEEITEKEGSTGLMKIIGIVLGCVLLLVVILLVMCFCIRKRGSWTVWKKKSKQPKERVKVEISKREKNGDKPEMV